MITPIKYVRKPLFVDAIQVTTQNFEEVAQWCQGDIQSTHDFEQGVTSDKNHIRVRVHNPKSVRQTQAFVGDWILYAERGYKVYTNKAFHNSFDQVEEEIKPGFSDAEEDIPKEGPLSETKTVDGVDEMID